MAVTPHTIQQVLSPYVYKTFAGNSGDARIIRAIDSARVYVTAMLNRYKKSFDENNNTIHQAVILMTIYELYSSVENEEVAKDKKDHAHELLSSTFGAGYTKSYEDENSPSATSPFRAPVASVHTRKKTHRWRIA